MASKGYGNLWIMAIGLIAVFVVATVIAPQLMSNGKTSSGDGWNTDMPSGEAIFQAPIATPTALKLEANKAVDLSLRAPPMADTTGRGGTFAWVFQLEGADGRSNVANLKYNGVSVVWSQGSSGALVGVGPRFIQGPGAASMDVTSSISIAITDATVDYTLKVWIAASSSTSDINPMNYTSVSPMAKVAITMEKTVASSVSVNQLMSVPAAITEDGWYNFTVTNTAAASGRWSGSIATYVAIEKNGIKASDVSVRIATGTGYSYPTVTDEGNTLMVLMTTKTPLTGRADPESASWVTVFEMSFAAAGNYTLTSWAENSKTGEEITTQQTRDTLEVQSAVVIPEPEPEPEPEPIDPNSTNNSTVDQNQTPIIPVVNNSGSSNNGVAASNSKSED